MIDKLVKVNLGSDGVFPVVKITQGDDMWSFHFQIFLDNKRWTIPAGSVINLAGRKPDGHSFDMSCTITDNEAHIDCNKQLTAAAGFVNAVLQVFSNEGKLVQSCKIVFACAPDPKGNIPVSESDMSAYAQLLERYEELITSGVSTVRDDIADLRDTKQDKITSFGILKRSSGGIIGPAAAGEDYATPAQVDEKYTKPEYGIPKEHLDDDVQASLGKADTALQEHQSLTAYRTAAAQDVIDAGKLSTDGDGSNVTAAFTAASTRTNLTTGEKLSALFGKIAKWFSDLGSAAFRGTTSSVTQGSTDLVESGAVYTGLAEKYSKPAGGIPDSDIASAATWNAKGTYSKPAAGIPVTDLAQDIQDALDDVADLKEAAISGSATDLIVDNSLSASSENPVQNKVIKAKFDELENAIPDAVTVDSDFSDSSENPLQNKVITEKLANALFIATPNGTGILQRAISGGKAVTNIAQKGVAYGSYNFQATLTVNGWAEGQAGISQTVSDPKIIADGSSYAYIITPSGASFTEYVDCEIYADDITTNGTITFHASTVPENALTVNIIRLVSTNSV